jgi:hypothetical protein
MHAPDLPDLASSGRSTSQAGLFDEFTVSQDGDGQWKATHEMTGHEIEASDLGALAISAQAYRIASDLRPSPWL